MSLVREDLKSYDYPTLMRKFFREKVERAEFRERIAIESYIHHGLAIAYMREQGPIWYGIERTHSCKYLVKYHSEAERKAAMQLYGTRVDDINGSI